MSANPNGLPSESLQTAGALPTWTTLPPSAFDLLERLGQIIYGEVGQGEGVARPATPRMDLTGGVAECVCQPSPSFLGSSGVPSRAAQKRRARSGSSAGNSINDSRARDTGQDNSRAPKRAYGCLRLY